MIKVLVTGATGNVGMEVIKSLQKIDHQLEIVAAVRNLEVDAIKFADIKIRLTQFDFTDYTTYDSALQGCDILYLVRPPQISEVEKYFKPIIDMCINNRVKHIVFLSVQGVEKSQIIPHHKIESLIVRSKISYTFLRPAYFMQNFTTTLHNDLIKNRQIYLPAGNSKFTLVDVRDIGSVSAIILRDYLKHLNKAYELTCNEKLSFSEMAKILSFNLGIKIEYKSPNLINFFLTKRKEGMPTMFVLVMIMLHYFPRFQKEPQTTDCVMQITGRQPGTFEQFIADHREALIK